MKVLFTIFLFLFFTSAHSQDVQYANLPEQTSDSLINESSKELAKFVRNTAIGNGLVIFGAIACLAAPRVANDPSIMYVSGAIMIVIGGIISLSAPNHIGNAASLMQYSSGYSNKSKARKSRKTNASRAE